MCVCCCTISGAILIHLKVKAKAELSSHPLAIVEDYRDAQQENNFVQLDFSRYRSFILQNGSDLN